MPHAQSALFQTSGLRQGACGPHTHVPKLPHTWRAPHGLPQSIVPPHPSGCVPHMFAPHVQGWHCISVVCSTVVPFMNQTPKDGGCPDGPRHTIPVHGGVAGSWTIRSGWPSLSTSATPTTAEIGRMLTDASVEMLACVRLGKLRKSDEAPGAWHMSTFTGGLPESETLELNLDFAPFARFAS